MTAPSPGPIAAVEQDRGAARVRLRGDLTVPSAGTLYRRLRALSLKPGLREVIVDFTDAERVDSSGIAAVSLVGRDLERRGVRFEITALDERHRGAFDLSRAPATPSSEPSEPQGLIERAGERVLDVAASLRALLALIASTFRQTLAVATRRAKLPSGSVSRQIATMGADGVPIVAALSGLLGMTMAFQSVIQLQRFGAGVFVADAIGMSMVRELAPLMAAVILTGRTGAAIAAELGTMRVRSEIDALAAMGISPTRFLVVPRLLAITVAGPALALIAMAVAIAGGMLVAAATLDMPIGAFWERVTERVQLADFAHGLSKSFVFAWVVGFSGAHFGLRARADASSVGEATTRSVVAGISMIIVVDAIFASIDTVGVAQ